MADFWLFTWLQQINWQCGGIPPFTQHAFQFAQQMANTACVEIPQEVTNEIAITLVYYLAQQFTL